MARFAPAPPRAPCLTVEPNSDRSHVHKDIKQSFIPRVSKHT